MQAIDEEKKEDNDLYEIISLFDLYNLQQQYIDLYDLRKANEYKIHHIEEARNIPEPLKFNKFSEEYDLPIIIYGNSNIMTKNVCDRLYKIAQSQNKEKRFAVFKGNYAEFYQKYKFLCESSDNDEEAMGNSSDNDEEAIIYPSMIIEDKLYLGDIYNAENKDIVNNLNITHIINVSNSQSKLDKNLKAKIEYLQIAIEDDSKQNISIYFDKANTFIDKAFNENSANVVLVHCMRGQSRSASIIISFLMKSKGYSLIDGYLHTKKCRPITSPNTGFYKELIAYEKKLFNKSTKNELEKALRLKKWTFNYFSGSWDMT